MIVNEVFEERMTGRLLLCHLGLFGGATLLVELEVVEQLGLDQTIFGVGFEELFDLVPDLVDLYLSGGRVYGRGLCHVGHQAGAAKADDESNNKILVQHGSNV
jgi:hypothetical protein